MTDSILSCSCPEFTKFEVTEIGIKVTISNMMYGSLLRSKNTALTQVLEENESISIDTNNNEVSFEMKLPFLTEYTPLAPATVYPDFKKLNRAAEILSILTQSIYVEFRNQDEDRKETYALSHQPQLMFFQAFFSQGQSSYSLTDQKIILELSAETMKIIHSLIKESNSFLALPGCEKAIFYKYCLLSSQSLAEADQKLNNFNPSLNSLRISLYSGGLNIKIPNASGNAAMVLKISQKHTGLNYTSHNLTSSLDLLVMTMAIIELLEKLRVSGSTEYMII